MKATKAATPLGVAAGLTALVVPLVVLLAGCWLTPVNRGTSAATLAITMKQPAAAVSSAALVVTGPGMAPIAREISLADSQVRLEVPAGKDRTFRVLINTVSVTFMGESTVDLLAGQATVVNLYPELYATQIIVPDAANSQLVQISDLKGTAWTALGPRAFEPLEGEGYMFQPWDVDVDDRGRIYVANMGSDGPIPGVFRFASVNSPAATESVDYWTSVSVAVDRANNYVYYIDENNMLYWKSVDDLAGEPASFDIAGQFEVTDIKGIAVDELGFVYVANYAESAVARFDLNAGELAAYQPIEQPWDVMVKGDSVYVASLGGEGPPQVYELTKDLEFVDAYAGPVEDPLVGPKRFVATVNPEVYVIDEGYRLDEPFNRVVGLGKQLGTDWKTYGTTGPAGLVGNFQFFEPDF